MPVKEGAELGDHFCTVGELFVAVVVTRRAFHDCSGQASRLRAPLGKAHQPGQGREAGRRKQVMLKDQPVSQLGPCFGVVLTLHQSQKLGYAIYVGVAVVHPCPVHHPGIEPSHGL
ncbi:hypothetical protein ACIRO3_34480 [Streptomyces sp. NPDC102278]|uniref:hypothetical protein n=1 Tax=Streptomyces sp. NPDC102278 TaxID=3366152 RepID=UPI0038022B9F